MKILRMYIPVGQRRYWECRRTWHHTTFLLFTAVVGHSDRFML